jgi:hypothetical protein
MAISKKLIGISRVSNTLRITPKLFIAMQVQKELNPGGSCCHSKAGISCYDSAKREIFDFLAHRYVRCSREKTDKFMIQFLEDFI